MPAVTVKWQKELLKKVEIDPNLPPLVFRSLLYDLTGVPPERQKIVINGSLIKDDDDWSTLNVKEGQKLIMMGTADEIVKAPEKSPVFMEDLPEEHSIAVGHTAGLNNMGNTCYMNSTLQCLHSVPELRLELMKFSDEKPNFLDENSYLLTAATRELFIELDKSVKPVTPLKFWLKLCEKHPQFGQRHFGACMQQDAEECWNQILRTLSQSLRAQNGSGNPEAVKKLFQIDLVSRMHCEESGEESSGPESVYSLKCHISQEVNHLHEGLKHGLKSELGWFSPSLGCGQNYRKESRIINLPRYLTVQFARFFWKRDTNQKAKILRKVNYPLELDIYDLCSDELRQRLEASRKLLSDEEGAQHGSKNPEKKPKETDVKMLDTKGSSSEEGETSAPSYQEGATSHSKEQLTGVYELVSVITHKGRSADLGHYVAWVKQDNGKWIQFDDSKPTPQHEEDITVFSGGGDWHMAYICMYKARVISE